MSRELLVPRTARMHDYLPSVNGMPDVGQDRGWTLGNWSRSPVERIAVELLTATQTYLRPAKVEHYLRTGRRRSEGLLPCLVAAGGRVFIAEGHHRAVAAILRGDSHFEGHLKQATVVSR